MHDLTTAISLLETAVEIGKQNNVTTISRIVVKFGTFSEFSLPKFRQNLETTKPNYDMLKNTVIDIIEEHGTILCNVCGYQGEVVDEIIRNESHDIPTQVQCGKCKSMDTTLISGQQVYIDKLDVKG